MKLIDLLVRELPKRGGWPDGADWCVFHDIDEEVSFGYRLSPLLIDGTWTTTENDSHWICRGDFYHQNSNDFDSEIVTRDQYQSALAALQKVEWSGDGLPPVGCECEFTCGPYSVTRGELSGIIPDEGIVVEVVAHKKTTDGNDIAVAYWDDKGAGRSACFVAACFRPLRSEADKRRDAAAKEMARHANDDENRGFDAGLRNCLSIYDAIAAGKIPGVKLEG